MRLLFLLLCAYVLATALAYAFQRALQYAPNRKRPGSPDKVGLHGMQALTIETPDRLELLAWFMPPAQHAGKIIFFTHGNAGNIADRAVKVRYFIERGYGFYLCEYRGYGGNAGRPSEQGLYTDARSGLEWLRQQGYSAEQIILYGESIGTGVAVQMGLEIQPPAIILETPFASARDVARARYPWLPVDWLMKDRFDSIDKISKIRTHLLIIHGDEDMTVSIDQGKLLFEAARHPKEMITINGGGHSDLYDHHAGHIIVDWLRKNNFGAGAV